MRKEVEKMKKFGLIGLMLLVILATPAMAQTCSPRCTMDDITLRAGPITVPNPVSLANFKLSDSDAEIDYGESIAIQGSWLDLGDNCGITRFLVLVDARDFLKFVNGEKDYDYLMDKSKIQPVIQACGSGSSS
ncbi:MAG: hypothetical protein QXU17_05610, partial [Archaeoglobaceae archaeon]